MFETSLLFPTRTVDGNLIIQLQVKRGDFLEWYDAQDKEKTFDVDIKPHRNKRSLDANSYFHVLCGKIADKVGSSLIEVKNRMIALYGQPEIIDGGLDYMIIRDEIETEKFTELHLQPTAQTRELKGKLYRVYINMRGSHDLDSKEMARLIDGTISEGREVGLTDAEIMTPKEKELLKGYGL